MILKYNNDKEYRDYPAVSQSELSNLDYSPVMYKIKKEEQSKGNNPAFVFGSAVDCLLTRPTHFWKEFVVLTEKDPSENIKSICDSVFQGVIARDEIAIDDLNNYEDQILQVANAIGYGSKWKPETVISKIVEGGTEYFKVLISSIGKDVLSSEDYQKARDSVEALKTSKYTKKYFEEKNSIQIMFQVALLFEEEGVKCKSLLDMLYIDHINRRIRVIDIKTTGTSVYAFRSSYMKFRYYLQGAFYTQAVRQYILSDPELIDYEILSPLFLVVEKANINPPFIYEMTWADVNIATESGAYRDRKIKGYKELLRDLKWHEEKGLWEYPKEVYLNKGVIQLNELSISKDMVMI